MAVIGQIQPCPIEAFKNQLIKGMLIYQGALIIITGRDAINRTIYR
jgi:hypothetical protein